MSEYDIILGTFRGKIGYCFNYKDLEEVESLIKEIERLNNIITELEKYLKEFTPMAEFGTNRTYIPNDIVLDKLKELKENK